MKSLLVKSNCEKRTQAEEGHHPLFTSRAHHIFALLKKIEACQDSIPDILGSGRSRPSDRGGGDGHADPERRGGGGLQKIFFWPLGPQFGLKIRGAAPPGPSPRSATARCDTSVVL